MRSVANDYRRVGTGNLQVVEAEVEDHGVTRAGHEVATGRLGSGLKDGSA